MRDTYTGGRLANISKNGLTTGEESMHTGNDYGFICGQYDGSQNNNGYLFTYASPTFTFVAERSSEISPELTILFA